MGALTHAQLVTEALELAGNTSLTTRAQTWLGLILRELYERYPFPVQASAGEVNDVPITPQTVAAGVQTLLLGSAGVTTVRSIRRAWICVNGQADFTELAVEHASNMAAPPRAYTGAPGVSRGRPARMIVHVTADNTVRAYFDPIPEQTYALWFHTEGYLNALGTYNASTVSSYPNDLTVVQGLYSLALRHQQDERAPSEWAEFQRMASNDRVRYASMNGANTKLKLSPKSFRRRSSSNPWDWMGPK